LSSYTGVSLTIQPLPGHFGVSVVMNIFPMGRNRVLRIERLDKSCLKLEQSMHDRIDRSGDELGRE
jgi:hypothetical protein